MAKDDAVSVGVSTTGGADAPHAKYERLIARAKEGPPVTTIVAHPCDETSLRGAMEAADAGIIVPVLVGPAGRIAATAGTYGLDIGRFKVVDAPHSHAAAEKAVQLIREGKAELLMKGSLHTDELLRSVTSSATGLRTERRLSHVFIMDVPTYAETLFITDAAINIFPDPRSQARHRAERHRPVHAGRSGNPAGSAAVGGGDGHHQDSVHDRCGRYEDGGSRTDHGRHPRWSAGVRQCDRSEGGEDQGHPIRGCRPRANPCCPRSRSRQHACQEPDLPRQGGRRRHGAGARACRSF